MWLAMGEAISLDFPAKMSQAEIDELQSELTQIDGIEDVEPLTDRSVLDPQMVQTVMMGIQLAGGIIGVAGAAAAVVKQIREIFQKKGIKGGKVTLQDGRVIAFDDASPEDIEKMIAVTEPKPESPPAS